MEIVILLVLFLLNGLFAMSEMSVVSSRKPRLTQWAEDGKPGAAAALALANTPGMFLSTIQVGITVIGVLSGAFGEATLSLQLEAYLAQWPALARYAEETSLIVVVAGITFCSLIIGELVPKRLALLNPEAVASLIARPMQFLTRVGYPVVRLLSFITESILKLAGARSGDRVPVTEEEIRLLMEQGTEAGVFEPHEQRMVSRVFHMDEERVSSIMTPRMDIVSLDVEDPFEDNRRKMLEHDYSRFVLCRGGIDNVIGIVRAKALLRELLEGREVNLAGHAMPPLYVPGSISVTDLLWTFKRQRSNYALVLDEYGELEGLVTSADVMATLVGDIAGPGQAQDADILRRDDGSWLVDGATTLHRVREVIDVGELPGEAEGIYHTLGGFVMAALGRVPRASDKLEAAGHRFEVMDMDRNRVDKVLVTPLAADDADAGR